jgi:hypothetical protein
MVGDGHAQLRRPRRIDPERARLHARTDPRLTCKMTQGDTRRHGPPFKIADSYSAVLGRRGRRHWTTEPGSPPRPRVRVLRGCSDVR